MTLKCDKDGQEFGSEIALSMHLKDKHGIIDSTETSKAVTKANSVPYKLSSLISKRKNIIISVVVIAILILSISLLIPKSINAQSVDGIQCNSLEGSVMHIHPHLIIIYNGKNLTVPSQIGILSTCLYGLHTHDSSGTIHVESPIVANYTVGEFIDIWNKTEPQGPNYNVLSLFNNSIVAYIGNTTYTGNYRDIILKDGEQIKLVITSR